MPAVAAKRWRSTRSAEQAEAEREPEVASPEPRVDSVVLQAEPQPAVRLPGRVSRRPELAQPEREGRLVAVLRTRAEPE